MRTKIEIELPKGFVYLGYRLANRGELVFDTARQKVVELFTNSLTEQYVIEPVRKTHRIFETDGIKKHAKYGDYFTDDVNSTMECMLSGGQTAESVYIWKEVKGAGFCYARTLDERPSSWDD